MEEMEQDLFFKRLKYLYLERRHQCPSWECWSPQQSPGGGEAHPPSPGPPSDERIAPYSPQAVIFKGTRSLLVSFRRFLRNFFCKRSLTFYFIKSESSVIRRRLKRRVQYCNRFNFISR